MLVGEKRAAAPAEAPAAPGDGSCSSSTKKPRKGSMHQNTTTASTATCGSRCVAYYDEWKDCMGPSRRGAGGYFLGRLMEVQQHGDSNNNKTVKVQFDDGYKGSFSAKRIHELEGATVDGIKCLVFKGEPPAKCLKVYCQLEPTILAVGDQVYGRYQNGVKLYRGRVAAVCTSSMQCTIVYDDGDVETGVPFGFGHHGNVLKNLVAPSFALKWMDGLRIQLQPKRRGKGDDANKGGVIRVSNSQETRIEYKHITEKRATHSIVTKILQDALANSKQPAQEWCDAVPPPATASMTMTPCSNGRVATAAATTTSTSVAKTTSAPAAASSAAACVTLSSNRSSLPSKADAIEELLRETSRNANRMTAADTDYDDDTYNNAAAAAVAPPPHLKSSSVSSHRRAPASSGLAKRKKSYREDSSSDDEEEEEEEEPSPDDLIPNNRSGRVGRPPKNNNKSNLSSSPSPSQLKQPPPSSSSVGSSRRRRASAAAPRSYKEDSDDDDDDAGTGGAQDKENDLLVPYNPPTKKKTASTRRNNKNNNILRTIGEESMLSASKSSAKQQQRGQSATSSGSIGAGSSSSGPSQKKRTQNKVKDDKPPAKEGGRGGRSSAAKTADEEREKQALSEDEIDAMMSEVQILSDDEMSVEPIDDSSTSTYVPRETKITSITVREMPADVSERFIEAFNSPHSKYATKLARIIHNVYGLAPTRDGSKTILEFIRKGPTYGSTYFPDPNMMDFVLDYLSTLMSVPGMKRHLAQLVSDNYVEQCLDQLSAIYYAADGDENRIGSDAILRTAQSFHAKAWCADVSAKLLRAEMDFCIEDPTRCENQPIVKHMVAHRYGTKHHLERAVAAAAKLWVHHGHFKVGMKNLTTTEQKYPPSWQDVSLARRSASELFESLGQICTYLAWLYGSVEKQKGKMVARVIANCFLREMNLHSHFDESPFVTDDKETYYKCIKLDFVFSLRNDLVEQLRPLVAKGLGIGKLWNQLHDDTLFF